MKRKLLLLAAFCVPFCTFAQVKDFELGDKTNKKAYLPSMLRLVESEVPGQLLVVEPNLKAVGSPNGVKSVKVRLCDKEWKDAASVELPNSSGCEIANVFRDGDILNVILTCNEDSKQTLRHVALNAKTLSINGDNLLVNESLEKKDESYVWTQFSPNGNFFGVVYAKWGNENIAMAKLYDNKMNLLWTQELRYSDIYNVVVGDNGTIATMRLGTVDGNKNATAFRVNVADKTESKGLDFVLNADVSDVALLNCKDGKMVFTALEGEGGYGPLKMGHMGFRKYTGLWAMVIDYENETISASNRHEFTSDELCTFQCEPGGTKLLHKWVRFLRELNHCATPQGGAVLYHQNWEEETRDRTSGMSNTTVYSKGMLLVQVDMNGQITINRISQNNQNANHPSVGADMFMHGDKLYVVTNESAKEPDGYDPDRVAKRSKKLFTANCALSVYWFTPDGQGDKKVVERNRKALISTPLCSSQDGRYCFLTMGGLTPNIAILTLQ